MNEAFKPADEIRELKIYSSYYIDMKKKADKSIVAYMNRFEKAATFAKQYKIKGCRKLDLWDLVGLDETYLVGQKENSTHGFFFILVKFSLISKGLQIHIGHIIQ